ncbi:unnamed protein product, partial [Mesorhabditis spiculigera]
MINEPTPAPDVDPGVDPTQAVELTDDSVMEHDGPPVKIQRTDPEESQVTVSWTQFESDLSEIPLPEEVLNFKDPNIPKKDQEQLAGLQAFQLREESEKDSDSEADPDEQLEFEIEALPEERPAPRLLIDLSHRPSRNSYPDKPSEEEAEQELNHPWSYRALEQPRCTLEELRQLNVDFSDTFPSRSIRRQRKLNNYRQLHAPIRYTKDDEPIYPIHGLTHLDDVRAFRKHAKEVLIRYTNNPGLVAHEEPSSKAPKRPQKAGTWPTTDQPRMPILYRIIAYRTARGFLLEAVNIEVFAKFEELRFISLDSKSLDRANDTAGLHTLQGAIGDLIWVVELSIPNVFIRENMVEKTRAESRIRGIPLKDRKTVFRASIFEAIQRTEGEVCPGYTLYTPPSAAPYKKTTQLAVMGQSRVVHVPGDLLHGRYKRFASDQLYMCHTRKPISSANYLAIIPHSQDDENAILEYAKQIEPTVFAEAPMPRYVTTFPHSRTSDYQDRIDRFSKYKENSEFGCRILLENLRIGLSAQEVKESMEIDYKQWPAKVTLTKTVLNQSGIIKARVVIDGKTTAGAWTNRDEVIISFTGEAQLAVIARLMKISFEGNPIERTICDTIPNIIDYSRLDPIAVPDMEYDATVYRLSEHRPSWIQETLKKGFGHLKPHQPAYQMIDTLYNSQRGRRHLEEIPTTRRVPTLDKRIPTSTTVDNTPRQLTNEQRQAIALIASGTPIGAILAAFGTGKTTTIAEAVAHIAEQSRNRVIVCSNTNNAVGQLVNAILATNNENRERIVHRFKAEGIAETISTDGDLPTLAQSILEDPAGAPLTTTDRQKVIEFVRSRRLIQGYFANTLTLVSDILEAERNLMHDEIPGDNARAVYDIIARWRRPHVLAATINSLPRLQTGLFEQTLQTVRTIIIDESSVMPEAALVAMACRFPDASIYLVGDTKQSRPYSALMPQAQPIDYALRQALAVAMNSTQVPTVFFEKTWRAHPLVAEFASHFFYEGRLTTEVTDMQRPAFKRLHLNLPKAGPLVFVTYEGTAARSPGGSLSNTAECEYTRQILDRIRQSYPLRKTMVITFYNAQGEEVDQMLKDLAWADTRRTSVERSQGAETGIALVLTTRSERAQEGDWFTDRLRACVALTRARDAVIILGTKEAFASDWWTQAFQSAEGEGMVTSIDALLAHPQHL